MTSFTTDDGCVLNWQIEGEAGRPPVVLSNSLGTNLQMWQQQMPELMHHFRVLRYDGRGHGQSGLSPTVYGIDRLGRDVLALLDAANVERAHFCGLSMGGMIGQWLGRMAPDRIDRLVLCNTAARIGPPDLWDRRIAAVEQGGIAAIVPGVIERWFTKDFCARDKAEVERIAAMLRQTPAAGYIAACAAIRDIDQREQVKAIKAPTLVIAGTFDQATTPVDGRFLADQIAGARYLELPAAHLSNIETSEAFNAAPIEFLTAGDNADG